MFCTRFESTLKMLSLNKQTQTITKVDALSPGLTMGVQSVVFKLNAQDIMQAEKSLLILLKTHAGQ